MGATTEGELGSAQGAVIDIERPTPRDSIDVEVELVAPI